MTSNRMLRGLWIAAAGACIALGAGHGVAAAESDSTDGGAGPSPAKASESSSQSVDATSAIAKDVDKEKDSPAGAKVVDKPTSTVSASTVTVKRADPVASEPVGSEPVGSEPAERQAAKSPKRVEPAEVTIPEPVAAQPVVKDEPKVVEELAAAPQPVVEDAEQVVEVAEQSAIVIPDPTDEPAPATEASSNLTTTRSLAAPGIVRPTPGPIATILISLLSPFGLLPPLPPVPANVVGVPAVPVPGTSNVNGVTGVKVGSSSLAIPVGTSTYTGAADWYFPTQADGTVQAQGVMLLQHGFLGSNFWYSALASDLARRTNSIVVVPNIPSFGFFTCADCTLSSIPMAQGVASLFSDPSRTSLNASALAAGYHGTLPEKFTLTGHSAGGGLAATAGGFYSVDPANDDLLGVVMFDGVSSNGTFATAVASLDAREVPIYQIAAPPQSWNANGQTTAELVTLHSGQFVGAVLAGGSHVDSLIGGSPIIDFVSQLLIKRSPAGNTQAVYTLATGWINDMYAGKGPTSEDPYGIYGDPDQYLVLGPTAAVVLGPPPVVDLNEYLGTWYEVGSVKQFFSIGLVNTTAVYTDDGDGIVGVKNSGNYFFDNGPQSTIVVSAVSLNADNNKLNVTFFGPASATQPGNYWIVDLDPKYNWAVVSDSTGGSGFLLSRTRTVSDDLYQELLNRASVKGVNGWITRTRQPAAALETVAV